MKRRNFCQSAASLVSAAALPGAVRAAFEVSDLTALRASLRGRLLLATDADFDAARRLWNGAFDRRPALIVRCADAEDVVTALGFARAHGLPLAVRAGGHSFAGHSSCDGGLMIDLSPMRAVQLNRAGRTVRVEAGVLLGELDRATLGVGLVTTTGTVSDTGVAGLTLGGGFGRLARRFGLACDNLVSAEIVSAAGQRLTAGATGDADLFWALRGGGGNFGVVTSFEFGLHAAPARTLGGALAFPFVKPRELLRAFADFSAHASDDCCAMLDIVPTPQGRLVVVDVCHCGPDPAAERELGLLRRIGAVAQDSVRTTPYLELQSRIDGDYPAGRGYYLKSGFVRELSPRLIDAVVECLEAGPAPRCIASFLQLGGAIARVRPDATAYWHRDAAYQVLLAGFWDTPAEAEAPRHWVKTRWETLEPLTDGFYVNLAGPHESSRRIRRTYGGNYQRLAALKRRYDPANLFRLNTNIPPAGT